MLTRVPRWVAHAVVTSGLESGVSLDRPNGYRPMIYPLHADPESPLATSN